MEKYFTNFGIVGLQSKSKGRPMSMSNYKGKKRKSENCLKKKKISL